MEGPAWCSLQSPLLPLVATVVRSQTSSTLDFFDSQHFSSLTKWGQSKPDPDSYSRWQLRHQSFQAEAGGETFWSSNCLQSPQLSGKASWWWSSLSLSGHRCNAFSRDNFSGKVGEVSNETPTLTHWRDLHKCHSEGSYSHSKTLMSNWTGCMERWYIFSFLY